MTDSATIRVKARTMLLPFDKWDIAVLVPILMRIGSMHATVEPKRLLVLHTRLVAQ